RLAPLFWFAGGYRVRPAAEVLAEHPTAKSDGKAHPLAVWQPYKTGRCLFLGFEETWRWRFREDERHFNNFWIQTVRFLAQRDGAASKDRRESAAVTKEAQQAIDAGLAYLAAQQHADGSWGTAIYKGNTGITGLAGLALLAAGHHPGCGRHG